MTNNISLLDYELVHGKFDAIIASYKEVPAKVADDNTIIRDAYIDLVLDLHTGESIKTRLYSRRVSYVMCSLNRYFDNNFYSLRSLLNYCGTHRFPVNITIDPKYGMQVEYGV